MKRSRRSVALVTLAAFAWTATGCYSYRAVPLTHVSLQKERMTRRHVQFAFATGAVAMEVSEIDMPFVDGIVKAVPTRIGPEVMVDLRKVRALTLLERTGGNEVRRALPIGQDALRAEDVHTALLEATVENGQLTLGSSRLEWPYLIGVLFRGHGRARVDLSRVTRMEVLRPDYAKTAGAVVVSTAGLLAALLLIVALTKESCPFVYVDRGDGYELVGEAYAGAAFQSVQRDDLLPLPPVGPGPLRVRLRNEARETQYTDRAELVVVERPVGARALSTYDGEVVIVESSTAALSVVDLQGRDAGELAARTDGLTWERDIVAAAGTKDPPLRDGLVAVFDRPRGRDAVLELVVGNTPWLDLVFGRFFAAMGDRLDHYLASGNKPSAAAGIRGWKRREGVDLLVEYLDGHAWREIAVVPTVGPIAMRHVAVPLPAGEGKATVRLSGGPGFWRVDQMALSLRDATPVATRSVVARRARTDDGADARSVLSVVDGRHNALARMDEAVDLEFDVPAPAAGAAQDAFLLTTGYYNVHTPLQSKHSPRTLLALRRQRGAFGRFSIDLAREYLKVIRTARSEPAR